MDELAKHYNNFISNVNFSGMRLISSEFIRNPEYDDYSFSELKKVLSFEVEQIESDEDSFFPQVFWTFILKKGNKILVKIKAGYELAYIGSLENQNADFLDPVLQRFIDTVVKPASYPYFRQKVASISNDGFLEIPTMPMLKLFPDNKQANELSKKK